MMVNVHGRPQRGWLVLVTLLAWPTGGCTADEPGALTLRPAGPEEDVWTIRCLTVATPDRFRSAKNLAQALKKVDGLNPRLVQVFHDETSSAIYYGRYKRRYNASSGKESFQPDPQADLSLIRKLSLSVAGRPVWPFALAVLDAWPTTSSGNPAWDLNNVDGYWSLQIAVFYNEGQMRQRKRAAERYCQILRDQGVEAYYHHGVVNSSVCVGIFPKEALATFQTEDPLTGVLRPRTRIVDPRMLELQKKYPYNLENGHKIYEIVRDRQSGAKERLPRTSFPVKLPRADRPPRR